VQVSVWTASQKDDVESADIVVGTHAVLQDTFSAPRLALIIVDGQHRFGVRQRQKLRRQGTVPHLLSMTATPIPRTLALALYGDLSVSFLKEKPKDRLPVITSLVRDDQRPSMYRRAEEEIKGGRQVFVICPLIEEK